LNNNCANFNIIKSVNIINKEHKNNINNERLISNKLYECDKIKNSSINNNEIFEIKDLNNDTFDDNIDEYSEYMDNENKILNDNNYEKFFKKFIKLSINDNDKDLSLDNHNKLNEVNLSNNIIKKQNKINYINDNKNTFKCNKDKNKNNEKMLNLKKEKSLMQIIVMINLILKK